MGKRESFVGWDSVSADDFSRTRARRAALYATAKIALGAAGALGLALGGCGGQASGQETAGGLDSGAEDTPATAGGAAGMGRGTSAGGALGGDLSCTGPFTLTLPPALPGPTDTEFECCVDFVVTRARESATANSAAQHDPAVDNCCGLIIAGVEIDFRRYASTAPTRNSCCHFGTGHPSALAQMCTPWGPPVPPAIDWEAA